MLVKIEPNRIVQTVQNFELFDKKKTNKQTKKQKKKEQNKTNTKQVFKTIFTKR